MSRVRQWAMGLQGAYYVVTGVWPLIHIPSFEAVTGPKVEDWLVHTVGLLATAIGITLGVGVLRREAGTTALVTLSICSALAFAGIDLWYGLRGVIRPIYLADGVIELGWIILVGLTRRPEPSSNHS
jgi:hypothetical protein